MREHPLKSSTVLFFCLNGVTGCPLFGATIYLYMGMYGGSGLQEVAELHTADFFPRIQWLINNVFLPWRKTVNRFSFFCAVSSAKGLRGRWHRRRGGGAGSCVCLGTFPAHRDDISFRVRWLRLGNAPIRRRANALLRTLPESLILKYPPQPAGCGVTTEACKAAVSERRATPPPHLRYATVSQGPPGRAK